MAVVTGLALAALLGLALAALLGTGSRSRRAGACGRGHDRHRAGHRRGGLCDGRGGRPRLRGDGPGRLVARDRPAPRPDQPPDDGDAPGRDAGVADRRGRRRHAPPGERRGGDPLRRRRSRGPRGRAPRLDPRAAPARRRADPLRRLGHHDPSLGDRRPPRLGLGAGRRPDLPRDGQEPDPALRREPRRHRRHPLRQGPLPPDDRPGRPRRRHPPRPASARRMASPRARTPTTSSTSSGRSGRRSPSCSTSTAASRASSPSKTCSKNWSGRSTTSTTSRPPTTPSSRSTARATRSTPRSTSSS